MQHHEICDLIPGMSESQYETLREDIRQKGQLNEIVVYEGAILDGKHRYRACTELGIEPRFKNYEGDDPVGFVFSNNIVHRHLEKGQLAMAGARLKGYYAEKAKERMVIGRPKEGVERVPQVPEDHGKARDHAAAQVGVSGRSVDKAEHILKNGIPSLVAKVNSGEISLSQADKIASHDTRKQKRMVDIPDNKTRTAALGRAETRASRAGRVYNDHVPGTPMVRNVLARLELLSNEISASRLTPQEFAQQFRNEFSWAEPLLVDRLRRAQLAIEMVSSLALMGEQAKRQAA